MRLAAFRRGSCSNLPAPATGKIFVFIGVTWRARLKPSDKRTPAHSSPSTFSSRPKDLRINASSAAVARRIIAPTTPNADGLRFHIARYFPPAIAMSLMAVRYEPYLSRRLNTPQSSLLLGATAAHHRPQSWSGKRIDVRTGYSSSNRSPHIRRIFRDSRIVSLGGVSVNLSEISIIPLYRAVLCLDCEAVSNARGIQCPACGSSAIHNLQQYAKAQKEKAA